MADLRVLIDQTEWWVDRRNRRHRIATMDVNHARHAAAMVRRMAPTHPLLVRLHVIDQAGRFDDRTEYRNPDPLAKVADVERLLRERVEWWVERTPLMRALRDRQSRRGPTWPFTWVPEASVEEPPAPEPIVVPATGERVYLP